MIRVYWHWWWFTDTVLRRPGLPPFRLLHQRFPGEDVWILGPLQVIKHRRW